MVILFEFVIPFTVRSSSLKTYDYFRKQKDSALSDANNAIAAVLKLTAPYYRILRVAATDQLEEFFYKVLRVRTHTVDRR